MNVWIAGGSGLIGKRLATTLLKGGHEVTLLTRQKTGPAHWTGKAKLLIWDGKNIPLSFPPPSAIVNLCGAGIADSRWSTARKRILLDSRVQPILAFENYLNKISEKPRIFLQASAVGFYGTSLENKALTEDSANGNDFLSQLCLQWESAVQGIQSLGIRTAFARTGIVLDPQGGALAKILPPFRFFIGGRLGNGNQWFPWIHRDDEAGALAFLLENENASGAFNLCSPGILTNAEFSEALSLVLHRPGFATVPALILKALLGEMSTLLLDGQKTVPKRLSELGYSFRHEDVHSALTDLLTHPRA